MRAVGECVWALYLSVTEKADGGEALSLPAAQSREVWVQYSALQIALQVRTRLQAFLYCVTTTWSSSTFCKTLIPQAYHQSLKNRPGDTSLSGSSHTRLFLTSFSQVQFFYCSRGVLNPFPPTHVIVSSFRWPVTLTHIVTSCPLSRPSWSQLFVPNLSCVLQASSALIKHDSIH